MSQSTSRISVVTRSNTSGERDIKETKLKTSAKQSEASKKKSDTYKKAEDWIKTAEQIIEETMTQNEAHRLWLDDPTRP